MDRFLGAIGFSLTVELELVVFLSAGILVFLSIPTEDQKIDDQVAQRSIHQWQWKRTLGLLGRSVDFASAGMWTVSLSS